MSVEGLVENRDPVQRINSLDCSGEDKSLAIKALRFGVLEEKQLTTPKGIAYLKFLRKVARHEAGHGADGKWISITIVPGPGYVGLTRSYLDHGLSPIERCNSLIRRCLRGGIAAGCNDGCGSDYAQALNFAKLLHRWTGVAAEEYMSNGRNDAISEVSANDSYIEDLSWRLLRNKTLAA